MHCKHGPCRDCDVQMVIVLKVVTVQLCETEK
jgi:hypothetical protein